MKDTQWYVDQAKQIDSLRREFYRIRMLLFLSALFKNPEDMLIILATMNLESCRSLPKQISSL